MWIPVFPLYQMLVLYYQVVNRPTFGGKIRIRKQRRGILWRVVIRVIPFITMVIYRLRKARHIIIITKCSIVVYYNLNSNVPAVIVMSPSYHSSMSLVPRNIMNMSIHNLMMSLDFI